MFVRRQTFCTVFSEVPIIMIRYTNRSEYISWLPNAEGEEI